MSEISYEDALAHFGVKGMKWGVRKEQHALNKASRKRDRQQREQAIDTARARLRSGQSSADLKTAKQQYKIDKQQIGSREAKKILRKHRQDAYNEAALANEIKNGREFAVNYAITVGSALAIAAIASAARR